MGANEKHDATYHSGQYTPDTTRVRHAYVDHVDYSAQLHGLDSDDKHAGGAFDRWLETVRAEAKAEALEEAASEIYRLDGDDAKMYNEDLSATPVNAWLRDRANQYKEEPANGR